jgi:hypothetical protein
MALLGSIDGTRAEDAKFPTDEPVRAGMKTIRDLTLTTHSLVTHRRLAPADARAFHAKVTAAVDRIETQTTLQGQPRTEIDALAADIVKGAASVAGLDPSLPALDGIVTIDEALARYAQRFDHPGWQPLR